MKLKDRPQGGGYKTGGWKRPLGIALGATAYYHNNMTTITCKIPKELDAGLEAAARQRRVTKSQIVRDALVASLRKAKPKVSAFDLVKDLCGVIKGGPRDYASNPKYLKGFGGK